ncbi:MAG: hypothetical protein Q9197_006920, partial [Variospora fuerteventurae]
NALSSASNLVSGLGPGSTAGDVTAAVDSLATLESDFSLLSAGADAWELESFGPSGSQIFTQVQTQQSALRGAVKSIGSTLSQLRGCVSTPGACQNAYQTVAGVLLGGSIGGPLAYIYNYDDNAIRPTQTSKGSSPPTVTTTSTATPTSWIFNTVPGTSIAAFKSFIQTLPDRGVGEQIIFGRDISHAYVGTWTLNEARIIAQDPIVDMMSSNERMVGNLQGFQSNDTAAVSESMLSRRAPNLRIAYENPRETQRYQKMISYPKNRRFSDLSDADPIWAYASEVSGGAGSWIYSFDNGFDFEHREYAGADIEEYVAPGLVNLAGQIDNSISDDSKGHGTAMGAIVIGLFGGVAKGAGLVGVKISSDTQNPDPRDVIAAWKWAVEDVKSKPERIGRAVFNLPFVFPFQLWIGNNYHVPRHYAPPNNIPRPRYSDWLVPLLVEAWDTGITVVTCTGNTGPVSVMGDASPQRFVTPNNPLIVVGSVDADGSASYFNLPVGPPTINFDRRLQGGVTVYAPGADIKAAIPGTPEHPFDNYAVVSGSSFSCSITSGLAAYYFGLPTESWPAPRDIPMAMKRKLIQTSRDGSQGGLLVVHNGVWDLPCQAPPPPTKKKARDVLKSGGRDDLTQARKEALRASRKLKGLEPVDISF